MSAKEDVVGLIGFVLVCFLAAAAGSLAMQPGSTDWYRSPSWAPPNWVFGPVWTALYAMMAVAAWLIWRQGGLAAARVPLALFAVQLVLNAAWSPIFFGLRRPGIAFAEIVVLWLAIAATTIAFWRRSPWAGGLMLPYLGWVGFASVLNLAIWRLNG